jgi:thiamine biosynthesis lipoprotein
MARNDLQTRADQWLKVRNIHRFSHNAMATIFEIYIVHKDYMYASQAAHAAFVELDRLEQELSRFIENSDVSRINNLSKFQLIIIGIDALNCINECKSLCEDTKGAFDISAGPLIDFWRKSQINQYEDIDASINLLKNQVGLNNLVINQERHEVQLLSDAIRLDFGGYGKGYAIDKMAEVLEDWSISQTFIQGGNSTVKALDPPPSEKGWVVSISDPFDYSRVIQNITLNHRSLSGSGLQKGTHIVNPKTGFPTKDKIAAWASAASAAVSDALSTSFMVMPPEIIKGYIENHKDVSALVVVPQENGCDHANKILRFGDF